MCGGSGQRRSSHKTQGRGLKKEELIRRVEIFVSQKPTKRIKRKREEITQNSEREIKKNTAG